MQYLLKWSLHPAITVQRILRSAAVIRSFLIRRQSRAAVLNWVFTKLHTCTDFSSSVYHSHSGYSIIKRVTRGSPQCWWLMLVYVGALRLWHMPKISLFWWFYSLGILSSWAANCGLGINDYKTELILFSRTRLKPSEYGCWGVGCFRCLLSWSISMLL